MMAFVLVGIQQTQTHFEEITPTNEATEENSNPLFEIRAKKIDIFFEKIDAPLAGYGKKIVIEAEKNDLHWTILPAIARVESTGGKFAYNNNPFGWGKVAFDDFHHAIEVLAVNLGGNNPTTQRWYNNDKTLKQKLRYYNHVDKDYRKKVLAYMEEIENIAD